MGRTIQEINIVDVEKRKIPSKHYVYIIHVTWSDNSVNVIYRRYSRFFDFQSQLMDTFAEEAGTMDPQKRIIPFLPGKKFFGRSHIREVAIKRMTPIAEYCKAIVKLPRKISQCKEVMEFFELEPDDIDPPQGRKASMKARKISKPKPLDVYIAVAEYTKQEKGEVTLKLGMLAEIVEKTETGWWFVNVEEEQGWVPSTCLEREDGIKEDSTVKFEKGEEEKYLCTEEFEAQGDDEISMERGAVVDVIEKNLEGWWLVRYGGKEGYVPATFLIKTESFKISKHNRKKSGKAKKTASQGPQIVKSLHEISDLLNEDKGSAPERPKTVPAISSTKPLTTPVNPGEDNEAFDEGEEQIYSVQELSKILQKGRRGSEETEKVYEHIQSMKSRSLKRYGSTRPPPRQAAKPSPESQRSTPKIQRMASISKEYLTIAAFADVVGDGISFEAGQHVTVLEKSESGWWYIEINGQEGWAPATYIEEVTPVINKPKVHPPLPKQSGKSGRRSSEDLTSTEPEPSRRQSAVETIGGLASALKAKLKTNKSPPTPPRKDFLNDDYDTCSTVSDTEADSSPVADRKTSVISQDRTKSPMAGRSPVANRKTWAVNVGGTSPVTDRKTSVGNPDKIVNKPMAGMLANSTSPAVKKSPIRSLQPPPPPPPSTAKQGGADVKQPPVALPKHLPTEAKPPTIGANLKPTATDKPKLDIQLKPGRPLSPALNEKSKPELQLKPKPPVKLKPSDASINTELEGGKVNVAGLAGALKAKFESKEQDETVVRPKPNITSTTKSVPGPKPAAPNFAKKPVRGAPSNQVSSKPQTQAKPSWVKDSSEQNSNQAKASVNSSGAKVTDLASVLKAKFENRQMDGSEADTKIGGESKSVVGIAIKHPNKPTRPSTPPTQKKTALPDHRKLDPGKYSARPLPPSPAKEKQEDKQTKALPNLPVKPGVKPKPTVGKGMARSSSTDSNSDSDSPAGGVSNIANALKAKLGGMTTSQSNSSHKPKPNTKSGQVNVKPKQFDNDASTSDIENNNAKNSERLSGKDMFSAIADFDGINEGEMSLTMGQEVELVEAADSWWYVASQAGDIQGWVPATYLEKAQSTSVSITSKRKPSHSPTDSPSHNVFKTCSDFHAENEGELNVACGEEVTVLEQPEGGWWFVRTGQQEGWIPASYLTQ